ncbi:MAG: sporulation peptidase YabG [Acetivibrionales bacterium]|jgi:spore coat assembly protein
MNIFKVGDIVGRKSYGSDIYFRISNIIQNRGYKPVYVLKGLMYRIEADSDEDDLEKLDVQKVRSNINSTLSDAKRNMKKCLYRSNRLLFPLFRAEPGKILHIDADKDFLDMCIQHYREAKISHVGELASESKQPGVVRKLLEKHNPDILVVTGHDSIKKNADKQDSLSNYRNSGYFIESVKEARKYEPSNRKLCVFAGACQSYFEAIMEAGANFASSPGRILINALDPAFVSEKVALTDYRMMVTPREISLITISGSEGIGGINTRGHLK